jgi:hypothetical protein
MFYLFSCYKHIKKYKRYIKNNLLPRCSLSLGQAIKPPKKSRLRSEVMSDAPEIRNQDLLPLLHWLPPEVRHQVIRDYLTAGEQIRHGPRLGVRVNADVLDFRHDDKNQITDELLACLPLGCPTRTIYSNECRQITDEGMLCMARTCQQLTHLDLSWCEKITDNTLQFISIGCQQLTRLDLTRCDGITDAGLQAISEGCHQLTHLGLSKCWRITDDGLRAISERCQQLTYLDLQDCDDRITDNALQFISIGCQQLIHLDLSK